MSEIKIDFKPFYLSSDLKFHQIDIIKFFSNNSIFLDLLNAEILNNQSLNAVVNIYSNKIKDINYLSNISLKTYFDKELQEKYEKNYFTNIIILK